jgi:hypothetical protein
MSWGKVDDNLAFHPKVVAAGNAAMGLWVRAMSWSAQQLTDGFVPKEIALTLGTAAQAKRLVTAGLWSTMNTRDFCGFQFHEWEHYQPTREDVLRRRSEGTERQRRSREKRSQSQDVTRDNYVTDGGSHGPVTTTRPGPSRPVPTENAFRGDLTDHYAQEGHPFYPDHCEDHAYMAVPGPCGRCKERRLLRESGLAGHSQWPDGYCIVHASRFWGNCSGCEADRKAVNA